jgi:hypothetical protein
MTSTVALCCDVKQGVIWVAPPPQALSAAVRSFLPTVCHAVLNTLQGVVKPGLTPAVPVGEAYACQLLQSQLQRCS